MRISACSTALRSNASCTPHKKFAAQRTLPAWRRTAFAPMGLGFVVDRFGLLLRRVSNQPLSLSRHGWLALQPATS